MSNVPGLPSRLGRLMRIAVLALPVFGCATRGNATTLRPPPGDENVWAIRCRTLQGANRFRLARNYADALKNVEGLKAELIQVFHDTDESVVYYGRYRRVYDAKNKKEAFRPDHLRDIDLIRRLSMTVQDSLAGSRVVWPFRNATMDTLPTGLGSHPEWHLSNAPGHYSLQVAVFYNTEGMRRRKYAAEEYCSLLRKQGQQAYYHHGTVNSSVCIGAFPKEAIQTFQEVDPYTGIINVKEKIVDKRMLELQRRYPYNLHNGHKFFETGRNPKTGKRYREAHTSFAVKIPRAETADEASGG